MIDRRVGFRKAPYSNSDNIYRMLFNIQRHILKNGNNIREIKNGKSRATCNIGAINRENNTTQYVLDNTMSKQTQIT